MDRLAMLQQFVSQKPDDAFARYGLAMELNKRGLAAQADAAFVELMARHPNYVPAYLMAGNALLARGDKDGAREVFTRGVEAARTAGDDHALGELEAARTALD